MSFLFINFDESDIWVPFSLLMYQFLYEIVNLSWLILCRFSVTKTSNVDRSFFWILKDDQPYAHYKLYSSQISDLKNIPGATTINLELRPGQLVRIVSDESSVIYGTLSPGVIYSWFTGYMLYAL